MNSEREFIKWLVAEHARVLRQIEIETTDRIGPPLTTRLSHIKNLCINSINHMDDKLRKLRESEREKWQ